jgi:hypothetical protein
VSAIARLVLVLAAAAIPKRFTRSNRFRCFCSAVMAFLPLAAAAAGALGGAPGPAESASAAAAGDC